MANRTSLDPEERVLREVRVFLGRQPGRVRILPEGRIDPLRESPGRRNAERLHDREMGSRPGRHRRRQYEARPRPQLHASQHPLLDGNRAIRPRLLQDRTIGQAPLDRDVEATVAPGNRVRGLTPEPFSPCCLGDSWRCCCDA